MTVKFPFLKHIFTLSFYKDRHPRKDACLSIKLFQIWSLKSGKPVVNFSSHLLQILILQGFLHTI